MAEIFTNFGTSTLVGNAAIGSTALTVQTGEGSRFPAPSGGDFFRALLFNKITAEYEFVVVTSRLGDVFTCAATTVAFNAGDIVENRPSSEFYNSLSSITGASIQSGSYFYGVDTGAPDSYLAAMTPTALTLTAGQEVRIKIGTGNNSTGGACTLKLDALAARSVIMEDGSNPPANSIKAGKIHTFVDNGTAYIFRPVGLALTDTAFDALNKQIKRVAAGSASTDVATIGGTEILSNKTVENGLFTGTQQGFAGDVSGNSSTADTLSTARTIAVSGSVSGDAAFDGSANITINAAQAADSINSSHIQDNTLTFADDLNRTDSSSDRSFNTSGVLVPVGVWNITGKNRVFNRLNPSIRNYSVVVETHNGPTGDWQALFTLFSHTEEDDDTGVFFTTETRASAQVISDGTNVRIKGFNLENLVLAKKIYA
jgi:hypothetical protein